MVVCWTLLHVAFSLQITIIKRIATQQKNYTKQTSNQSADCPEQGNQSIVRLHSTKQPIKTKETNIGEGAGCSHSAEEVEKSQFSPSETRTCVDVVSKVKQAEMTVWM